MAVPRALVLGIVVVAVVVLAVMLSQPQAEAPAADPTKPSNVPSDVSRMGASAPPESTMATGQRAPVETAEEVPLTVLSGTVLGPDGEPATDCGVIVMLQPMSESFERREAHPIPPWNTTTDETGVYRFELDLSEAEEWRGSLYAASSQLAVASHPLAMERGRRYELRAMQLPRAKTKEEVPPLVNALLVWSAALSGK